MNIKIQKFKFHMYIWQTFHNFLTIVLLCLLAVGCGHKDDNVQGTTEQPEVSAAEPAPKELEDLAEVLNVYRYRNTAPYPEERLTDEVPKDTIIYSPAPANLPLDLARYTHISFYNLPIRDKSFDEIFEIFGKPYRLEDVGKAGGRPWIRYTFPRFLYEKYRKYPEATLYRGRWHYNDGSGDVLVLEYIKVDGQRIIMNGYRKNSRYLGE